jgi:hypothetical protein|tara:strand:- start:109 stop:318 length:210 start_codon:yes stop_codon:yes gene_type:complete
MGKDWQRGQAFMNKDVKTEKVLGVGKDGYQTGGVNITKEVPNIEESQTVVVRGTKRMRADKKPVKATWY